MRVVVILVLAVTPIAAQFKSTVPLVVVGKFVNLPENSPPAGILPGFK